MKAGVPLAVFVLLGAAAGLIAFLRSTRTPVLEDRAAVEGAVVATPEPVSTPSPAPPAAILRNEPPLPAMSGENLAVYREARYVLVSNPRDFQKYFQHFRNDPKNWKEPLKHMASTDLDPRPRAFALKVLGTYADPSLEGFFRERLEKDDQSGPRRNAAEGLGMLPALSTVSREALQRASESDSDEVARTRAREALERHP